MSELKQLVSLEDYEQAIKSDKLCIIKFTAEWCPPCKAVAPDFVALSKEMADVVDDLPWCLNSLVSRCSSSWTISISSAGSRAACSSDADSLAILRFGSHQYVL